MEAARPHQADLVLAGGGVKGIAHVGVLSVLHERGYRFERAAGTSAGAIVAALVAAGMSPPRMHEISSRARVGLCTRADAPLPKGSSLRGIGRNTCGVTGRRQPQTKRTSMPANSAKRRRLKRCGATSTMKRWAGPQIATQPTTRIPCDSPSI